MLERIEHCNKLDDRNRLGDRNRIGDRNGLDDRNGLGNRNRPGDRPRDRRPAAGSATTTQHMLEFDRARVNIEAV